MGHKNTPKLYRS